MLLRSRLALPLPAARLQRFRRATQVQAAARSQQQPLTPPPVGTPLSAKKAVSQGAKTPAKTQRRCAFSSSWTPCLCAPGTRCERRVTCACGARAPAKRRGGLPPSNRPRTRQRSPPPWRGLLAPSCTVAAHAAPPAPPRSSVERARFDAAAQEALPLHPDPFQRAQYHEVRVEALLVGCALVASLWVSLLRKRGSLFPEGEEGYLARVRKAHTASLPKPRGGKGLDFGWPGKALAAAALAAADAFRPAPPQRAPPPLNLASSPSLADQSLAALVAEAQALQATMNAEVARLAALEAARVQAVEEASAATASAERAREAVNAAAAGSARAERETQDASYPVKAALAYAPFLPELAAQAVGAASETVRRLAREARQRIEDVALDAPLAAAAEEPVLPPPAPPPSSASPELAHMLLQAEVLQARMDAEARRLKRQDAAAAEQRRADVRQLAAQLGVSPQRPDKGASFPVVAAAAVASVAAMKGRKAE